MLKPHILRTILALAFTIAALSTPVPPAAAQQLPPAAECFNGQGSLNSNLPYRTNVTFKGKPLLIILEEYDSGKTANVYGWYHGRTDAKDGNNGFIYSYTPVEGACKRAVEAAVQLKYPKHRIVVQ